MDKSGNISKIKKEYGKAKRALDRYSLRFWIAEKSEKLGYGGIKILCEITGFSRKAIYNWKKKSALVKSNSNTSESHVRKPGSGCPKRLNSEKIISGINEILEIEKIQKQDLLAFYSPLSLRQLTSELNKKGIDISCVSLRSVLRENEFFTYGFNKSNKGNPRIARNIHAYRINLYASYCHKNSSPVFFLDMQKISSKKVKQSSIVKNKGRKAFLETLLEWWESERLKYPESSNILIFANGGSLMASPQILKQFANETNITTIFCHVPAGIIKWLNIDSEKFNKTICIRQNTKEVYYNATIYNIREPEGNPENVLEATPSFMYNGQWEKRSDWFSPREWYFAFKPAKKKNKT